MTFSKKRIAILTTCLLAAAFIGGCSSGGRMKESEEAVEGFQSLKSSLVNAQAQVDNTLTAMDQLSSGGNLQKTFSNYSDSVVVLQKSAENARNRSKEMNKNVDAYVKKWQKEIDQMEDPTIKASLSVRRDVVRNNFAQVRASAQGVKDAYDPFIADLQEIQKALAIDLTPAAVGGLRPAFGNASSEGRTLKVRLAALQAELDRIEARMSPSGKASPAK